MRRIWFSLVLLLCSCSDSNQAEREILNYIEELSFDDNGVDGDCIINKKIKLCIHGFREVRITFKSNDSNKYVIESEAIQSFIKNKLYEKKMKREREYKNKNIKRILSELEKIKMEVNNNE